MTVIHKTPAAMMVQPNLRDLTDLVARARAGTLRSSEVSDPTITMTNLGDQGVDSVFGVIYPPQVALVGFGRPTRRVLDWLNFLVGIHRRLHVAIPEKDYARLRTLSDVVRYVETHAV